MRRGALPGLAFVIALQLTVAAGALIGGVGDDPLSRVRKVERGAAGTSTTIAAPDRTDIDGPATESPADPDIEAAVAELSRFVEAERELRFKKPVAVELLDADAFKEALLGAEEEDVAELEATQGVLQAMDLLDKGVDLADRIDQLVGEGVVGFYDDKSDELTVRGQSVTPYVRLVLVHELTHALEDQHFDLGRDDLGDEAAAGFDALAEGSASVIDQRYRRSLSRDQRRELEAEERKDAGSADVDDIPEVLFAFFGFPYQYGPPLVEAILDKGGMKALDAAFADPPASTEQVLDPRRYLERDPPAAVAKPAADGPEIQDGEIGQLALFLMLDARLSRSRAGAAAQGWGGDRYVAWKDGGGTCMRFTMAMDSPRDVDELRSALGLWAKDRPRTSITGGETITFTTCTA